MIGAGTSFAPGAGNLNLSGIEPGFVDPPGDLMLLYDSPLVDSGDPGYDPFLGFDLWLRPRVIDGDGNGASVVDVGAQEYQHRTPVAVASAPADGGVGQALTFDGSESSDADDEPLTYSWSFDDGTEASGAGVQKAFSTPGPHTGTLTVTDPAGLSDEAAVTVAIAARPDGPIVPDPLDLDTLKLTPKRFRAVGAKKAGGAGSTRVAAGTRIRFTLSRAARVTFTVQRLLSGYRVGGACRAPKQGTGGRPCVRKRVKLGAFERDAQAGANSLRWGGRLRGKALKPGRYRLTAQARAADGTQSQPRGKRFKIVP